MHVHQQVESPAYLIHEARFRANLALIQHVKMEAGVEIILALKAFATWQLFPLVAEYLDGATASSLHEAQLIQEKMGKKAHTYAVAYLPNDFEAIAACSSHITFNSVAQFKRYQHQLPATISAGIRINPEYGTVETDLYNPAAKGSRLGVTAAAFANGLPTRIEGFHFHTLCESDAEDLVKTLEVVEVKFGRWLPQLQWLNMGGGHLMTRAGYNIPLLIETLQAFKAKYPNLKIILEPGSAIAWQTGELVATVLDIVENSGIQTAIVDVSFTAHMPDTLEMPYRPTILGATAPVPGKPTYRIGGVSCLAGDFMEAYSFEQVLQVGDRIVFEDMIHYTLVKTTMFNGVQHPSIYLERANGVLECLRKFTYEDYKTRMG